MKDGQETLGPIQPPIRMMDGYRIEVDRLDGKYKIFKYERGLRIAVAVFYDLCDLEAREVRELME